METYNPPPYREKRPPGRMPKYTLETRLQIGRKVKEKELTYKDAAKVYDISEGAVGVCVKLFKDYQKKGDKKIQRKENNKRYQQRINNYHQGSENSPNSWKRRNGWKLKVYVQFFPQIEDFILIFVEREFFSGFLLFGIGIW